MTGRQMSALSELSYKSLSLNDDADKLCFFLGSGLEHFLEIAQLFKRLTNTPLDLYK